MFCTTSVVRKKTTFVCFSILATRLNFFFSKRLPSHCRYAGCFGYYQVECPKHRVSHDDAFNYVGYYFKPW